MASITQQTPDGVVVRNIPSESRMIKELKKVYPGARFALADLVPTGGDKTVPCLELRYNPPAPAVGDAGVCAVPVGETDNDRTLAPLSLMRYAFRRLGYDVAITEIVSPGKSIATARSKTKPLDRIWRFTYVPLKAEAPLTATPPAETICPAEKPAAPDTKESDTDGFREEA